jgi:predicted ribonuclease YlaK
LTIDAPDVDLYTEMLGAKYFVHVVPVVLRELDELKRNGRNENVRESARKADMRLKKYRNNGDVLTGARVSGQVFVKFEHIEPEESGLPSWLDMSVPDDRFVASALLLQSKHPGSAFYVITSDINMQTKLSAVGMPFLEGARN